MERDSINGITDIVIEDFNSRAHVERDFEGTLSAEKKEISTHALTWSATSATPAAFNKSRYFNSRAHVERDSDYKKGVEDAQKFQLTRSRGARLVQPLVLVPPCDISTHALTWSATRSGRRSRR